VRRSLGEQPLVVGVDVLAPAPVGVIAGLLGQQDVIFVEQVHRAVLIGGRNALAIHILQGTHGR
jgi:hypothetical protein